MGSWENEDTTVTILNHELSRGCRVQLSVQTCLADPVTSLQENILADLITDRESRSVAYVTQVLQHFPDPWLNCSRVFLEQCLTAAHCGLAQK